MNPGSRPASLRAFDLGRLLTVVHRAANSRLLLFTVVFVIALESRWSFATLEHPLEHYVNRDMALYVERGRALLERSREARDLFTPVGYPALIALCEWAAPGDLGLLARVQAVIGALGAPISAWIARGLAGQVAGWLAGLAVAAYFPLVYYTGFALSEVLFSTLLVGGVALALRGWGQAASGWSVGAGLVFCAASIVRPSLLALVPLLATQALWAWRRRTGGNVGVVVAVWALALAPLALHNSHVRGAPTLVSTNGGVNFYLARSECRAVRSRVGGNPIEVSTHFNRTHYEQTCLIDARLDDERWLYLEGLRLLEQNPSGWVRGLSALGEGLGLAPYRPFPDQPYWPGSSLYDGPIDRFSRGFFWFAFLPAIAGFALARQRGRSGHVASRAVVVWIGTTLVSVLVVLAVYNGNPRVRVSSDPLVLVLASVAVAAALGDAGRRWNRRRVGGPRSSPIGEPSS